MTTPAMPVNPAINYATLKAELATNPQALSTAVLGVSSTLAQLAAIGHYQDCANLLNQRETVAAAAPVPRAPAPAPALRGQIVVADWVALTSVQKQDFEGRFGLAAMGGVVDLADPLTWSDIEVFFPSTSATYANLQGLRTRAPSRAETLFGAGTALTWQDVAQAWDWT